jgi:hypothetical protein
LQEREFDRIGGSHPIRADVRVSPQPTATWRPRSPAAPSEKTCIIA